MEYSFVSSNCHDNLVLGRRLPGVQRGPRGEDGKMKSMRKVALRTLLMSCFVAAGRSLGAGRAAGAEEESLEDIVITGEIQYRNRTDTVAPELVYDQQFFEQFEPLSVGDQLSRVPGVAFTSDIGERDAPQMRGLGEGFTQVLVNGRPIPGAGNDRTVFVDRIPAEIIDRIEIVRVTER